MTPTDTHTDEDDTMTDVTYTEAADPWTAAPDDDDFGRFRRQRGRFFNRWTVLLFAIVLGLVGFYAGIRVEKTHVTGATGSGFTAAASRASGSGTASTGAEASGTPSGAARASLRSGGFPGAAGGGTTGTVTSVKGDTIYVKETDGDTVAVKLLPSTTVTKSESVGKASVDPGDTVAITGATGKTGTVSATAVTDSGDSSTSSASSSSSGSTSTANTANATAGAAPAGFPGAGG